MGFNVIPIQDLATGKNGFKILSHPAQNNGAG